MVPHEFTGFVRQKPFRPYRLTLTDGRNYDIVHPDMAAVGFGSVIVGISSKGHKEGDSMRTILVSLLHVIQIEFIDVQASASETASSKQ